MNDWQRSGFGTVTPFLLTDDADTLLDFILDAFDADILVRLDRPDGSVMHVEVRVGDSMIMLGEPTDDLEAMPSSLFVYTEDCDEVFSEALEAGGTIVMEPTTMPAQGQRYGGVEDPTGNIWWIATHLEDIDVEEQARRIDEMNEASEPPYDEDDDY